MPSPIFVPLFALTFVSTCFPRYLNICLNLFPAIVLFLFCVRLDLLSDCLKLLVCACLNVALCLFFIYCCACSPL